MLKQRLKVLKQAQTLVCGVPNAIKCEDILLVANFSNYAWKKMPKNCEECLFCECVLRQAQKK